MKSHETILIIDFGSQFTQLITRRIREANVYSEIHPHTISIQKVKELNPKGIVLSGGPMSVYDEGAPDIDKSILETGVPILGICYGLQVLSSKFGGKVDPAKDREYGKSEFKIIADSPLFKNVRKNSTVWMSHGDYLTALPEGYKITGKSDHSPIRDGGNDEKKTYGVEFSTEVMHTEEGEKIIRNFLFDSCKCKGDWPPRNFIHESINRIREQVGEAKAICALSGGVDSTVAAMLVKEALGDNLTCNHIDTGLIRKNESSKIKKMFTENLHLNYIHIDASERFLSNLAGVI